MGLGVVVEDIMKFLSTLYIPDLHFSLIISLEIITIFNIRFP